MVPCEDWIEVNNPDQSEEMIIMKSLHRGRKINVGIQGSRKKFKIHKYKQNIKCSGLFPIIFG